MKHPKLKKFDTNIALGEELANRVCCALEDGITRRGKAVLAVSGGSTPKRFFNILSSRKLPWHQVIITLVDERWVAPLSERSNGRLVKQNLLIAEAQSADFVPLFKDCSNFDKAIETLENDVAKLPRPFDAVILGMGTDGHTASYFPGGDKLAKAVDPQAGRLLSTMQAPGASEMRVTFTLPVIAKANFLGLHIEGADKLQVLAQATEIDDPDLMPVRHVLNAARHLEVFWSP